MPRLEGKIALVTGGASMPGLGSATAIRFAEEGAHVVITDLSRDGAQKVVDLIAEKGGSAEALAHDVSSTNDWDDVFGHIEEQHGGLDVIVNNAGIAILRPIVDYTVEEWNRQCDINLNSVFHGTQRAVKLMRRIGRGGSIINISSIVGQVGVANTAAYAAAKGGVRIFSKTVALECAADNIRVNTVHPGMIMTNMQKTALEDNPEIYHQLVASIPMGRFGEPEDIANMNLFLASDESAYCTGVEFTVDGGMITQ